MSKSSGIETKYSHPFGMVMPGRQFQSGDGYRYGFNGMEKDDEIKGGGNSLDFGARIYDSRMGRWLSLDPSAAKFPSWGPYNFSLNSPIAVNDPDGREPNRAQATTMSAFIGYLKANKLTTVTDIYNHLKNNSTSVPRYIYTNKEGWMDMNHVFSVFQNGKLATDMLEPLSGSPIMRGLLFKGNGETSYYSYEDLPSNRVGNEIIRSYVDGKDVFVKAPEGDDLYDLLENGFSEREATSPENAPNYEQIPASGDRDVIKNFGYVKDLSEDEVKTGKYVPQNFTDEPYNLEDFPAADDSIENTKKSN